MICYRNMGISSQNKNKIFWALIEEVSNVFPQTPSPIVCYISS